MKPVRILLAALLAVALVASSNATEGGEHYYPPYEVGASGGDDFNLMQTQDDGRIVAARAYPIPSSIGCGAEGGWTLFEVTHHAEDEVASVSVDFSEAVVDPYVFVTINVIDADDEFLGSAHERGPLTGDGEIAVPLTWPVLAEDEEFEPRDIRIQFGLEITSACPSADAATVKFDVVHVGE